MTTHVTDGASALGNEGAQIVKNADSLSGKQRAAVKGKLAAFEGAQARLVRAEGAAHAAAAAVLVAEHKLAELDATQDAALDALVDVLVRGGANRLRPLTGISKLAPSAVKQLPFAKEAVECASIAKKAKGGPAVTKAARALGVAAAAIAGGEKKLVGAVATQHDAIATRTPIVLAWIKSRSALRHAAQGAEDDGIAGVVATLFAKGARKKTKRAAKKPVTPPVVTPPVATAS